MARCPLVAGNWKMNGLGASTAQLDDIIAGAAKLAERVDILVCPPFTLVAAFAARARSIDVRRNDGHGPVLASSRQFASEPL